MASFGIQAALVVVLAILSFCDVSSAAAGDFKKRVRKEIRNLSPGEYKMFMQALGVMWSTQTSAGKTIYGPKYKDLDYFVLKHAVNSMQPFGNPVLGNEIHFQPSFMTFHRAYNMEFENAVLSVVPDLKAMPYWEMASDLILGPHYKTKNWMWGPKYAGNKTGNPDYDYAVLDGPFGGRMVGKFNFAKWGQFASIYNGTLGDHYLRAPQNPQHNSYVVRYPAENMGKLGEPCCPKFPWYYEIAKGYDMNYTILDLARCTNTSIVKSSWDFVSCIEGAANQLSHLPDASKWLASISAWTHPMFHSIVGSFGLTVDNVTGSVPQGDARDLSTSPNEALQFFPDHANLDRAYMVWQASMRKINPNVTHEDDMYGFPKAVNCNWPTTGPTAKPCPNPPPVLSNSAIDDQMAPLMPFTDIFPWPTPKGVTHRDMLEWEPDYVYDNMNMYRYADGKPYRPPTSPKPSPASSPTSSPTPSPTSSPTPSPTSSPVSSPMPSPTPSPTGVTLTECKQCGGLGGNCKGAGGDDSGGVCADAPWRGFQCAAGTACRKDNVFYYLCVSTTNVTVAAGIQCGGLGGTCNAGAGGGGCCRNGTWANYQCASGTTCTQTNTAFVYDCA